MNFFEPFIDTGHVIFMVAGKYSHDISILIISQADVTSVKQQYVQNQGVSIIISVKETT